MKKIIPVICVILLCLIAYGCTDDFHTKDGIRDPHKHLPRLNDMMDHFGYTNVRWNKEPFLCNKGDDSGTGRFFKATNDQGKEVSGYACSLNYNVPFIELESQPQ